MCIRDSPWGEALGEGGPWRERPLGGSLQGAKEGVPVRGEASPRTGTRGCVRQGGAGAARQELSLIHILPPGADAHREKTEQPRRQGGQGRRSGAQGRGKAAQRRSRHDLQGLQDVQDKDLQDMLHRLPASLRDKTQQWLRYKAERGEPYGKTGLDSLIEAILLAVRRHGESAVLKVMGDCMACGYKGIAFDRLERMRRRVVDTNLSLIHI